MLLKSADVFDGNSWHSAADILVDGEVIGGLGRGASAPRGGPEIDLSGHTVIPGLVDGHLHLFPGFLGRLPAFGVTAVVDMFATPRLLARLREEGRRPQSARFVSPGTGAAPTGGHPHQLATQGMYEPFPGLDHPDQVLGFVRDRVAEGSAFVKVFLEDGTAAGIPLPMLDPDTLRRLVEVAHSSGLSVVAHATTVQTATRALAAGVDGLAHLPMPCGDAPAELTDGLVAALHSTGAFVVSTLVSLASLLGQEHASREFSPMTLNRLGPLWRQHLRLRAGPRDDASWSALLDLCAALVAARVPLLAGTDAAFPGVPPGASLHAEISLLRRCGLACDEALSAATLVPARVFGLEGSGSLHPGARADLVVLGSDPRGDTQATQDVVATMVGGRFVSRRDEKHDDNEARHVAESRSLGVNAP